ncbi:GNAT family N-acetyltransferase [uncultured Eudoraea sp.]|uniref:GNAT family N-acetyltransferase n=1 Tax=uncultured Eudoraea sp. TaxID=1035614 RepID=UPI00260D643E|nr:GNAT family N-acetyltransferase [uncultured Eudoraea sp.]
MNIQAKSFQDLTNQELYQILQLRTEVFVVEQDCVYQDLDGKDTKALHIIGTDKNEIVAYARIFKAGDYMDQTSIGRVLVRKSGRQAGYGKEIMLASIKAIKDNFKETTIHLSAQTYLQKFYNELGFTAVGEMYLEDGIPHLLMVKE